MQGGFGVSEWQALCIVLNTVVFGSVPTPNRQEVTDLYINDHIILPHLSSESRNKKKSGLVPEALKKMNLSTFNLLQLLNMLIN